MCIVTTYRLYDTLLTGRERAWCERKETGKKRDFEYDCMLDIKQWSMMWRFLNSKDRKIV